MKPHFRPIRWTDMPVSARKCVLRTQDALPTIDGRVRGWEWLTTFAEPTKIYAVGPGMVWAVADTAEQSPAM